MTLARFLTIYDDQKKMILYSCAANDSISVGNYRLINPLALLKTMAPRGRSRKVGLRRIDAALDALHPYGFSKKLITKNIDKLLEVYGGDTGWTFIEDGSYRLLIETILENDDESQVQAHNSVEHQGGSYGLPVETMLENDGKSEVQVLNPVEHQDRVKHQESQQVPSGRKPEAFVEASEQANVGPSQPVKAPSGGSSAGFTEAPEDLCHPQPVKVDEAKSLTRSLGHMGIIHPNRHRRRPFFYGWLSESEDEEDEVRERNRRRSRKSRWDVGPSEM